MGLITDLRKKSSGKKLPERVGKVFNMNTAKGLSDAEKYQQFLYRKYDEVKVEPFGLNKVKVIGMERRR